MAYEFEGVQYGKLRDMQEARRARYVQLLEEGLKPGVAGCRGSGASFGEVLCLRAARCRRAGRRC